MILEIIAGTIGKQGDVTVACEQANIGAYVVPGGYCVQDEIGVWQGVAANDHLLKG